MAKVHSFVVINEKLVENLIDKNIENKKGASTDAPFNVYMKKIISLQRLKLAQTYHQYKMPQL